MTQIQADATVIRNVQKTPNAAPELRPIGENGAGAFDELFAEKNAAPVETADSESNDAIESPSDDTATDEQGHESNEQSSADGSADATGAGGQTTVANGDEPADNVDAEVASGEPGDLTKALGINGQPQAAVVTNAEVAVPINGQSEVQQQLKNAASVDLASLARQKLSDNGNVSKQQATIAPEPDRAAPDRPSSQRSELPRTNTEQSGAQAGSQPRTPAEGGKPPPGFQPTPFRPDSVGTGVAIDAIPGKTPSDPSARISASGQARQGSSGVNGTGDAGLRTEAAAARAVFLERLANAGGARRGAVAATERVVGIERTLSAVEPKPALQRPISFKPIDPPPPTRDAFLSPVQKGLGKMLAEGGGRLTVMLRPQELGDVKIAMETRQGAVRVKMEATSEAARKALESGLETLRTSLESRGVKVEAMDVTLADRGHPADANSEGGSHRDRQQQHDDARDPKSGAADTGNEDADGQNVHGMTTSQANQLWTELGIDAVA